MASTKRCVMEVLKCADPVCVLRSAAIVNSVWASVCDSSELWQDQRDSAGFDDSENDSASAKLQYYEAFLSHRVNFCVLAGNDSKLHVYSFPEQRYVRELRFQDDLFSTQSAAAFISSKVVFVCGSSKGDAKRAALYSLAAGTVSLQPRMEFGRYYHSAVAIDRCVYVFGGNPPESSKSAERFNVRSGTWTRLPDMHTTRSSFTACVKDKEIYLCGGHTAETEVFSPNTSQYRRLPFKLSQRNWTVSFVFNNEVVAVVNNSVYFLRETGWKEETGEMVLIACVISRWGNMAAQSCGDLVYIPMFSCNKILEIDMTTLRSRKY